MADPTTEKTGIVYLVGAGPGDAGLLTLRGAECLGRADVVLYDYLVNPQVLEHAARDAELVCLGRHGHGRMIPQAEINDRMIRAARAGKRVVRLKGGDPIIFARAAEEIAALAGAGIPFEIVPGITAALAAGSYAGIPVTHRDNASAVALVVGHEQDEKAAEPLDFEALARFPGTLVVYMGVTTARHWSTKLVEHGKSADTPAAIVRRCSFPDQTTIRCTLGTVADEIEVRKMRPPAIVIVGAVAAAESTTCWFTDRPLFGVKVLVTRPVEQNTSLRTRLERLGAEVLVQPAIRIDPPADWRPVDRAIHQLSGYDWVVFSSTNGVQYFLDRMVERGRDMRCFGTAQIAVIGSATAELLAKYRLRADLTPDEFRAEALADALAPQAKDRRFLLVRASRGREVLAEQLTAAGAQVEQIVAYESRDVEEADADVAERLKAGEIDYVTVTSSAIARALAKLFGDALHRARLVSISPVTTATLDELGYTPYAEATTYTMEGVVDAIRVAATDAERAKDVKKL